MMVTRSKGNHPPMAARFRLVNYSNLPRYVGKPVPNTVTIVIIIIIIIMIIMIIIMRLIILMIITIKIIINNNTKQCGYSLHQLSMVFKCF